METKKTSKTEICAAHGELINLLIESQKLCAEQATMIGYHTTAFDKFSKKQEEHSEKLNGIEKIVTNGLQSDIKEIKESMSGFKNDLNGFMDSTRKKIMEFEEFSWFRKGVNKFRDSFLLKALWIIIFASIIILAMHFDTVMSVVSRTK